MRRLPLIVAVSTLSLVPGVARASPDASPNVRGVVLGVPSSPACFAGEPCDQPARPMLAFVRGGKVVRVRLDQNARFATVLAPGSYSVRVIPFQAGAGVKPGRVTVPPTGVVRFRLRLAFPSS